MKIIPKEMVCKWFLKRPNFLRTLMINSFCCEISHSEPRIWSQSTNFQVRYEDLGKVRQHSVVPGCFLVFYPLDIKWIIKPPMWSLHTHHKYKVVPKIPDITNILLEISHLFAYLHFHKWNKTFLSVHKHLDS